MQFQNFNISITFVVIMSFMSAIAIFIQLHIIDINYTRNLVSIMNINANTRKRKLIESY